MWSSPGEYMELYEKLIDWERAEQTGWGAGTVVCLLWHHICVVRKHFCIYCLVGDSTKGVHLGTRTLCTLGLSVCWLQNHPEHLHRLPCHQLTGQKAPNSSLSLPY